jgi:hypothetical protein
MWTFVFIFAFVFFNSAVSVLIAKSTKYLYWEILERWSSKLTICSLILPFSLFKVYIYPSLTFKSELTYSICPYNYFYKFVSC